MFERFSDSARRVVVLAQEEARMLGHNHIGSEHLLLGLLHEQGGVAAQALAATGITLEAARSQVGELAGRGEEPLTGHIPFTPRAKKILELSLRESLGHNKRYIGTEHVLLALLRDADGLGARVLERLGGSLSVLRQRVLDMAAETAPEPAPAAGWEGRQESETRRLLLPRGRGSPQARVQPEMITEFREALTTVAQRLANIERHLGITAEDEIHGGFRALLTSVDRHLGNIERHFGLSAEPPGTADEPPAATD